MDVCYSILKNLAIDPKEMMTGSLKFEKSFSVTLTESTDYRSILDVKRNSRSYSYQQTYGIWIENSTQLPENVKLILLFLFFLILISSIH